MNIEETREDFTYCKSDDCIHRIGCKRNISNYEKVLDNLYYIEDKLCKESEPYSYHFLIRFRNSDGSKCNKAN